MDFLRHTVILLIISVIAIILGIGCGYQFRANGEPVGINIDSIAIPLITSTSSDKGFEADFTRMIREEFISHAKIPIVASEEADKVLKGYVYEITTQPLTYDSTEREVAGRVVTYESTSSRRLQIRLDISLVERATGKTIWRDTSMEEEARFNVAADPLVTRYNQQKALIQISRLLAKRVYMKTMERF